jgi:hypothetical protein
MKKIINTEIFCEFILFDDLEVWLRFRFERGNCNIKILKEKLLWRIKRLNEKIKKQENNWKINN